ncbi:MAG TPA: histidine phosphatase family protein [Hellea balneolensis]|uniref:Histidine phosphatase family protein n=1 Tax=Hellea balneolensis TaxID=287478 RepID=A0A7C5LU66_9PROT|nr:histidine phosphatase family protein [Hellea balneolensis]
MSLSNLMVFRHAKSSWDHETLSDHQRPLNARGRRAAKTIGMVLRARKLMPDLVWSSDSQRTRETVVRAFGEDVKTEFLPSLYHASANTILSMCAEHGEPKCERFCLVGHNPGFEDLIYYLSGTPRRMPTGTCAVFKRTDSESDWLSPQSWHLQSYLKPRDFED